MPAAVISELRGILGADNLLTDAAECRAYGYDNSTLQGQPLAVALPHTHAQVEALVRCCYRHELPLIARGQGTGTTGATVPLEGDTLIVSMQRMAAIRSLDRRNRLMVVEPGATNQAVQQAAAREGFFWPPDPTSSAVCTVGGNLAYNSAGPRAVKYGTPRENTLALKAVTGRGDTIHTGVLTSKGVVGYDLTRLLIGSEGTLAVITEATLKLTPLQPAKRLLRAEYRDVQSAAHAVAEIMAQPVTPCALEFMDGAAIDMVRAEAPPDLHAEAGALLMIEVDGAEAQLDAMTRSIVEAAGVPGILSIHQARDAAETEALWSVRRALSPALRRVAPKKINEDVVVPVSRIPQLVERLAQLGEQYGLRIVNFGHAGNGNLHVNILFDANDAKQRSSAEACLEQVFDIVLSMHGTLSGEHGVGLVKRDWVAREIDPASLALMQAIKRQFDPGGILNPGKTLPLATPEAASHTNPA